MTLSLSVITDSLRAFAFSNSLNKKKERSFYANLATNHTFPQQQVFINVQS